MYAYTRIRTLEFMNARLMHHGSLWRVGVGVWSQLSSVDVDMGGCGGSCAAHVMGVGFCVGCMYVATGTRWWWLGMSLTRHRHLWVSCRCGCNTKIGVWRACAAQPTPTKTAAGGRFLLLAAAAAAQ